jgi:hypothetical protein
LVEKSGRIKGFLKKWIVALYHHRTVSIIAFPLWFQDRTPIPGNSCRLTPDTGWRPVRAAWPLPPEGKTPGEGEMIGKMDAYGGKTAIGIHFSVFYGFRDLEGEVPRL